MINPLTSCGTNAIIVPQQLERGKMNEKEAVSLFKAHGNWSLRKKRRANGKLYIYAQRRRGTEIDYRYVAPLSRLDRLTPEFLINKLEASEAAAATECHTFRSKIAIHSVA
jgi:hypothetical protein